MIIPPQLPELWYSLLESSFRSGEDARCVLIKEEASPKLYESLSVRRDALKVFNCRSVARRVGSDVKHKTSSSPVQTLFYLLIDLDIVQGQMHKTLLQKNIISTATTRNTQQDRHVCVCGSGLAVSGFGCWRCVAVTR